MTGQLTDKEISLLSAAKTDFLTFIELCFRELYPGEKFYMRCFIKAIAYRLYLAERGEYPKQIYNLPPRHLKSFIITVCFTAWRIGQDPSSRVILCSYSQDLTSKYLRDIRAIMETPWYKTIFPRTVISQKKNSETELTTTRRGFIYTTSTGGTLTGRGANIIIVDDPMSAVDIGSEVARRKVQDWFDTVLFSRQDNKDTAIFIVVMQRLHEDDLTGHIIKKEIFTKFSFPAIAIRDQKISTSDNKSYMRRRGRALNGSRENIKALQTIKKSIGSYNFEAQYQQNPVPAAGNLLKREWFKEYQKLPYIEDFKILISWDVASSTNDHADYTVGTFWVLSEKGCYLFNLIRKRMAFTDLAALAYESAQKHPGSITLVETAGSGRALYDVLLRAGVTTRTYTPQESKEVRAMRQSIHFENGWVFFKKDAPWLDDLYHELCAFPNGKYDDQVDSVTQALLAAEHYYKPFYNQITLNIYGINTQKPEKDERRLVVHK